MLVPLGVALGWALWRRHTSLHNAVPTTVAAVVTLVPEGLILLTSLTYAVAGIRMAARGVLAQQLNAIESLASVDTICIDKTGTLTDAQLQVEALLPASGVDEGGLAYELGRYAASAPSRNATLDAIDDYCGGEPEEPRGGVPFSSSRRWSALTLGAATYVLGAPELFALGELETVAEREARAGRRVVAFGDGRGRARRGEPAARARAARPRRARRAAARRRARDGRVLPRPGRAGHGPLRRPARDRRRGRRRRRHRRGAPRSTAATCPRDPASLRRLLDDHAVIGRIAPEDKRRVVEALTAGGRYVAMIGDGVNDVPALKAARLAIAQGSGSQMARSVADLVLVRGDFASVPALVAEGRKVLRNLQRVAKLFVTKSAFAAFLVLSIGLTPQAYPLLPRHLTLAAALTIGIPSFFLALAPSEGRFRSERFLFDVGRFAVPAGTAAGLGVRRELHVRAQRRPPAARRGAHDRDDRARARRPVPDPRARGDEPAACGRRSRSLIAAMLVLYALVLVAPFSRHFFALDASPARAASSSPSPAPRSRSVGLWPTDDRFVPGALREIP